MNFLFNLLFVIVPIFIFGVAIFMFSMLFSSKLRSKVIGTHIRRTNRMLDELKDDITEMGATMGSIAVNTEKSILEQNKEILEENERRKAEIEREGLEIKSKAIRDGLSKDMIYCKYCGTLIDEDSQFCKKCGKDQ